MATGQANSYQARQGALRLTDHADGLSANSLPPGSSRGFKGQVSWCLDQGE